jgi:hypothetical protein
MKDILIKPTYKIDLEGYNNTAENGDRKANITLNCTNNIAVNLRILRRVM